MKTLVLTDKQFSKLEDVLEACEDKGPYGYGWCSDELIELQEAVNEQAKD